MSRDHGKPKRGRRTHRPSRYVEPLDNGKAVTRQSAERTSSNGEAPDIRAGENDAAVTLRKDKMDS